MDQLNKNYNFIIILIISVFFFIFRWLISFESFPDENFFIKILYEIKDTYYFPLIKSLSNFDFYQVYSEEINKINIISFPFLSISIYSFFLKIFGEISFLFLELICIFLFLLIFSEIFKKIGFSKLYPILFSCFLFILTSLLKDLENLGLNFLELVNINFSSFFTLRLPRPIFTNLLLFSFLLLLLKIFYFNKFNKKNAIYLGLVSGITLNCFFYFFIFEFFLFLNLVIAFFSNGLIKHLKINIKFYILSFVIFIIFLTVFSYQILSGDEDYKIRIGLFDVGLNEKKIFLEHLLSFFTNFYFLALSLISLINFVIFKFYIKNNKILIFFYFFISTILSTIFFIVFTSAIIDPNHFLGWMLISGFLFNIVVLFYIFFYVSEKYYKKSLIIILILFSVFYYNFSYLNNYAKENKNRVYFGEIIKNFENLTNLSANLKILTFDMNIFNWLVMNDFKNFEIVPASFWTSRKNEQIETDIISSFKFLNLNDDDFISFFKNEKSSWRYKNPNTERFFDRTYLANKVKTFNNSMNFTPEEKKFILNTSSMITHQLVIPIDEFERLKQKFYYTDRIINPDIVFLNKNNFKNIIFKMNDNFCIFDSKGNYILYLNLGKFKNCK